MFAGDRRSGPSAAEPPDGAGVHGPEAGTSHKAVPPHREGQAGVLSAIRHVVHGES